MSPIDIRRRVGLRMRELRQDRGLTQEAVANSIGLSRNYYVDVENGRRNVSIVNLERIAKGLGVSLPDFFDPASFSDTE